MRSSTPKKQSKTVSTPLALLAIVVVVVIACVFGWRAIQPKEQPGVMSKEATIAAGQRYKFVVDRWNKEVELAKQQNRAPDTRLQPRPTGAMAPGGRPLGMENMGAGSLATAPGQGGGQQQLPAGVGR